MGLIARIRRLRSAKMRVTPENHFVILVPGHVDRSKVDFFDPSLEYFHVNCVGRQLDRMSPVKPRLGTKRYKTKCQGCGQALIIDDTPKIRQEFTHFFSGRLNENYLLQKLRMPRGGVSFVIVDSAGELTGEVDRLLKFHLPTGSKQEQLGLGARVSDGDENQP